MADFDDLKDEDVGGGPAADTSPDDEPKSLHDELAASWDAMEAASESADAPDSESGVPSLSDAPSDERPRDESGRFAAKAPDGDTPAPADKITDQDDKTKATGDTPQSDAVPSGPPVSWSADAKSEWGALSPATQAAVLKREQEASDGIRQKSEEIRRYATMEQMFAPRREVFAKLGYQNDVQVMDTLMKFADGWARDPDALVQHLASQRGLQVSKQTGQSDAPSQEFREDQGAHSAQPEDDRIARLEQHIAERERQDAQRVQDRNVALVERFIADPVNKHFEAVGPDVMAILPGIRSQNPNMSEEQLLKTAYDKACWTNEGVRQQILAEQNAAAEAKKQQEAKDRTERARRAGSSVTGAPNGSGGHAAAPALSLREELMERWSDGSPH